MDTNSIILGFLWCSSCLAFAQNSPFVCYIDLDCGASVERPLFFIGTSVDDCCAKPEIFSVKSVSAESCHNCTQSAKRITPLHVALYPPDDLVLEVAATVYEAVTWVINGTAMHDFNRLKLENNNKRFILSNTTEDDYGTYTADIYTSQLIMIDFHVYTYVPPSVSLSAPSEEETVNGLVNVTCTSNGNPIPDLALFCDDGITTTLYPPVYMEETFGMVPGTTQTASVVTAEADGIKACHCNASAYNGEGIETETTSVLLLAAPPTIVSFEPDEVIDVIAPLKVELTCRAKGRALPNVTWYMDREKIESDSHIALNNSVNGLVITSTLKILPSSSADYGYYYCAAINELGTANSTVVLINVQFPPKVTTSTPKLNINVNVQQEATFSCKAEGNPEPQIIWLGDGGILNDECGEEGFLGNVFGEAALDYTDFYSGNAEEDTSGYVPSNCKIQITKDTISEGVFTTTSSLTIKNLHQEQSSSFKCISDNSVVNMIGVKQHATLELILDDSPYFLGTPLESYSQQYSTLSNFSCDAIGQSVPEITWLKNGKFLLESDPNIVITSSMTNLENSTSVITNSTLLIESLGYDDAGTYTCRAENNEGTSHYNFSLDIYGVLLIHDSLQPLSPFMVGDVLVLSCNVSGPTTTNITWTHEDVPVIEDERTTVTVVLSDQLSDDTSSFFGTLIVDYLRLSDRGSYKCVATDGNAKVEKELASITVQVPVNVSIYPETTVHSSNIISTINCTASGVPAPLVQFMNTTCQYEIEAQTGEAAEVQSNGNFIVMCMSEETNTGLFIVTAIAEISSTDTFGVIELFCSAASVESTGNSSADIVIQAPPLITSPAVSDITVLVNEPFTLTCSASGYPGPKLSWKNNNGDLNNRTEIAMVTSNPVTLQNGLEFVESNLTVINDGLDYDGGYTCVASNDAGSSEKGIAIVNVQVPVTVSITPKTVEHIADKNMSTINCSSSGVPQPTVQFINVICRYETDQQLGEADEVQDSGDFSVYCKSDKQNNGLFIVTATAMIGGTGVNTFGVIELFCNSSNAISTSNDTGYITVQAGPKITSLSRGTLKILQSETFILTCTSTGYPVPAISWTRDGEELNSTAIDIGIPTNLPNGMQRRENVLIVTNASADDEGLYLCISLNDAGTTQLAVATIDIKVPPQVIDLSPSSVTHLVGDDSTISCTGHGDPPPTVTFHGIECTKGSSDEGKVSDDSTFVGQCSSREVEGGIIETTVSLMVSNNISLLGPVQLNCTANSSLGETDSETAVVYLTAPSTIAESPSAIIVEYGAPTLLMCTVTGYPIPEISWVFGNRPNVILPGVTVLISGYTSLSTLTIPETYPSDEGTYICRAKNLHYDSVSTSVDVSVSGVPPLILSGNLEHTLLVGSNITLSCNASGVLAPTITWLKSDEISAGSGDDLFLQPSSGNGPVVSEVVEGDTISITTSSSEPSGGQVAHTFSELVISGVGLLDEGTYSCVADNDFGKETKPVGLLIVEEPPSIFLSHQSVVHTVPGNTTITCTGTGKPLPTVTFGELECSGVAKAIETEGTITQCGSSIVSLGLYHLTATITLTETLSTFEKLSFICSAANGIYPSAMARVNVTIEVKKSITTSPESLIVDEEGSFAVFCEATGYPMPSLDWLFGEDSTLVIENKRISISFNSVNAYTVTSTLNVADVLPDDGGEYKCRAQSDGFIVSSILVQVVEKDECAVLNPCVHGTCIDGTKNYFCECDDGYEGINCDMAINKTVIVEPTLTEDPQNITMADLLTSFNLTCKASENPIYLWFRDGKLIHSDTEPVLTITEVDPSDRGYYVCQAINSAGNTTSEPGLVVIEGIYQYTAELEGNASLVLHNGGLNIEIGECLASESVTGVNSTIVYSVELCVGKQGCQHNGIAAILVTVYQTISPSSSSGIRDALDRKLNNLDAECNLKINVTNIWRFDGCRETEEVLHDRYQLSILWPESEIQDHVIKPCPCGTLTNSVYTNSTASRECGGDYTNGGQWYDSDTSSCEYNENNINITLTLCHLTSIEDSKNIAETLEIITAESNLFEPLDLTIASLVLENLVVSEDLRTERELQESFVQTISNLLSVDAEVAARSEEMHQSTSRILKAVETFQRILVIPTNLNETFTRKSQFMKERFAIVVLETSSSDFRNLTLVAEFDDSLIPIDGLNIFDQNEVQSSFNVSLSLPHTLANEANIRPESTVRIGYALLLGNVLFQGGDNSELGSQVAAGNRTLEPIIVAANLFDSKGNDVVAEGLSNPVVIEFRKPEYLSVNETKSFCIFWNESRTGDYGWSRDGCVLTSSDDEDIVRCECDHLTHFGYLLDVQPHDAEPEDLLELEIVIYILCTLSVICLLIIIVTYSSSEKLYYHTQGKTIINMSIALIGVYITYAIAINAEPIRGVKGIRGDILCGFFGALLYYFILVYFMWTGLEAVDLYRKLVKVFNKKNPRFVIYGGLISWGAPLIITAVAAIAGRDDYIEYKFFCRPVNLSFYIGFLFPFGLIYAFNWAIFIIIVASFVRRKSEKKEHQSHLIVDNKKIFFVAMILSFNFGLGWIFGLLVTSKLPRPVYLTFLVLFSVFVGLQGVLMFILHGARNQNARKMWRMWFYMLCCCQTKKDAKALAKLTFTPFATPANRRRNIPTSTAPDTSQTNPPISALAKKYFTATSDSERGSFASPINESDTMDTYMGESNFPIEMKEFGSFGDQHDEKEELESRPENRSFLKKLSKLSLGQILSETKERSNSSPVIEEEVDETSRKHSKKSKKKSKRTLIDEQGAIDNDFGGSTYSLGKAEYETQAVEIEYKPSPDDSDEDSWVQQQLRDIDVILNPNFANDTELETSFPGEV